MASLSMRCAVTSITGSALAGTSMALASMRTLFTWLSFTPGKSMRYGETCLGSSVCEILSKLPSWLSGF